MFKYEKLAVDHAKKYKSFDLFIAAKDAYLLAYQEAINDVNFYCNATEEIEVEFLDGTHQFS